MSSPSSPLSSSLSPQQQLLQSRRTALRPRLQRLAPVLENDSGVSSDHEHDATSGASQVLATIPPMRLCPIVVVVVVIASLENYSSSEGLDVRNSRWVSSKVP
ncbi:unnamed protein product [Heligmosomoides polygyrus]|uniref:Uncharacterized protein n=1 Tax=Heligmosomoides polygyrus TaxID=6339 RepID=A0A183FGT5_HELPZ|nr:unnamed protein product [Heligmosomoides polygyrus]